MNKVEKPWGSYEVLKEGTGYKVKELIVNPAEVLSYQSHFHRSEHWVGVEGTGIVILDGIEKLITENTNIFIPQLSKHRLKNIGNIPLKIIEVQYGQYLGEDDIVRYEDKYGR